MVAEFRVFHHTYTPPQKYAFPVRMRMWFDAKLKALFPAEGYELLSGILIGQKQVLTPLLQEHLRQSGLMHIVVVSGSNVIMIIIFLSLFLRFLPAWARIIVTMSTIILFVLVVGGDVPVIRAAIMGVVGYGVHLW